MFFCYILHSESFDRFYVGHCEDLAARLKRHNGKAVTSTKAYVPWVLVYFETFPSRSEAVARETMIKKKKSRAYIQSLIKSSGGTGRHVPNSKSGFAACSNGSIPFRGTRPFLLKRLFNAPCFFATYYILKILTVFMLGTARIWLHV